MAGAGGGGSGRQQTVAGAVLGQALAILMALMSVVTKYMFRSLNVSAPALQNCLGYALTCLLFLPGFVFTSGDRPTIGGRKLVALFIIALIDSQASFQANVAFRFGVPVASAGMLSTFTIPCVMALSYLFLGTQYSRLHVFGILTAITGIICVFASDAESVRTVATTAAPIAVTPAPQTASNGLEFRYVLGDVLILTAAATYALSNVFSEGYVKSNSIFEYLVYVGLFGASISAFEVWYFAELSNRRTALMSHKAEVSLAAYAILFALVTVSSAKYMERFDALFFNISLLTTGFWGMVFGYIFFRESVSALKLSGYAVVVLGIYLYQISEKRRALVEETPLISV